MAFSESNPDQYETLLTDKITHFRELFSDYDLSKLTVFPSSPLHFRMRAEFRIWKDGEKLDYVMFKRSGNRQRVIIEDFPIADQRICQAMPRLLEHIKTIPILRENLYQAEFLCSLSNELLISLIYHKHLDEDWLTEAKNLKHVLNADIVGRSRKQKVAVDRDYIIESLTVFDRQFKYMQLDNCFSQPNAKVCEKMLEWAANQCTELEGDLLELYCGNGNFTIPLATNFDKVLATEIGKSSVKAAEFNFELNNSSNIKIGRVSSEDFTKALNRERPFFRLKHIDLDQYKFTTVFVDPPRSGLDPNTLKLISQFETIIYISCNPQTLYDNLSDLSGSHQPVAWATFDQFPYTNHLEAGLVLKRI